MYVRRFGGLGVAVYRQKIRKPNRSSGFSKHHPTREQWRQIRFLLHNENDVQPTGAVMLPAASLPPSPGEGEPFVS